ncbi:antA/AntB antirepressor family protein [Odoribacter laneus]|jgi:phage anti-repressor protein|uniref:antA/AntB antirepressor family protein n=1 Tax=Odoribacter laneus TaxID=626933 RepID=UPI003FED5183
MNELIKIVENNGKQAVSARELYEKLGFASQHWASWYKKNITSNAFAVENEDFAQLPLSGRTLDFALSIDFAKRLAMMARTETGEQIRNYFIEVEKRATKPLSQLDILAQSVQILQAQEKRIAQVENRVKIIEAKQAIRSNFFTIVGYATLQGIQCGLKMACSLGRKATNLCKQRGVKPEEIPDPRFGKVKTYPEEILKEVFAMPIN